MGREFYQWLGIGVVGATVLLAEPGCTPVTASQPLIPPSISTATVTRTSRLAPIDVVPESNPYIPDFNVDPKLELGLGISLLSSIDKQTRANEIFAAKLPTQIFVLTKQFSRAERLNMKFDVWGVDSQYGYTIRLTTQDHSKSYIWVNIGSSSDPGVWIKVPEGAKIAAEDLAKTPNTYLENDIFQPVYIVNGIYFGDNGVLESSSVPQDHKTDYNKAVINYQFAIDNALRLFIVTQALNQSGTKDATYSLVVYYDPNSDTCTGVLSQYLQTGVKKYSVDSKGRIHLIDSQSRKKSKTLFAWNRSTRLSKPKSSMMSYRQMAISTNRSTRNTVKNLPIVI